MVLSANFEIVEVADECLAVPVGSMTSISKDVYTFSKAAGYLLHKLRKPMTIDEIVDAIVNEYDLDRVTAENDVNEFIKSLLEYGIILEQ